MRTKGISVALIALPLSAFADSPEPFVVELRAIDRIFEATRSPRTKDAALGVLESVAEGRVAAMDDAMAGQFGFAPGQLRQTWFQAPGVKMYAIQKIGETGLPEAAAFLSGLKPDDPAQRAAVQIAAQQITLNRIADEGEQARFLTGVLNEALTDRESAAHLAAVVHWALNELCDRGDPEAPALFRARNAQWDSSSRGDEQAQFCDARVRVLARGGSKTKSLASVLTTDFASLVDLRLASWAIDQLGAVDSNESRAELRRFASALAKLPDPSAERERLWPLVERVRAVEVRRTQ